MTIATYDYLLTAFPNNQYEYHALRQEVLDSSITSTLENIVPDAGDDKVWFVFDPALTSPEETMLDNIVAAHQGTPCARGPIDPVLDYTNTPPGSPAINDRYVVGASPTGAWSGHAHELTFWDGSSWQFMDATKGTHCWCEALDDLLIYSGSLWNLVLREAGAGRSLSAPFNWFIADKDYVEVSTTAWTVIATFPFRGTLHDVPKAVKIIGSRSSSTDASELRLYDVTNANEIALIQWTAVAKAIYSDETPTNLPTSEAVFEFQAKKSSGAAGKTRVHSAVLV